jgi:ribosomal protein S13
MVEVVLTVAVFFVFCILFMTFGYFLNNITNNPKEKAKQIEKMTELNEEFKQINEQLVKKVQLTEEANKNNYQWYINQLYNLGNYLKTRHNDDHILLQLNQLTGQNTQSDEIKKEQKKEEEIILELDKILDRISDIGYENLTEKEKTYLNELKNNENKE